MTWRELVVIEWVCDGCGVEHAAADDSQPNGWEHTTTGDDLCPECRA